MKRKENIQDDAFHHGRFACLSNVTISILPLSIRCYSVSQDLIQIKKALKNQIRSTR